MSQKPPIRPEPKEDISALESRRALEASVQMYPSKRQRTAGPVPQNESASFFNAPQILASPLSQLFFKVMHLMFRKH